MAVALVAAAGSGDRLGGDAPKALAPLAGRPLVAWCLEALAGAEGIERVVIAAPEGFEGPLGALARAAAAPLEVEVVTGGSSRSQSVASALRAADSEVVVVQDAARPLLTPELVERCLAALERWACDGVVAAARATDTVKEADAGGHVIATLERSNLWIVQTPQVLRAEALRRGLESEAAARAYDDAQLIEAVGGDVRIVEAPRQNMKVTTPFDLRLAEMLLEQRRGC